MSDNTTLNAATAAGGDVVRNKDRAGIKTQIVALDLNPAGAETLMSGAMPVTGTFFQATQPVSLAANTPDVTDRAGRLLGTIANTAFTVNAGTNLNTSALALDATLTAGTQKAIARTAAKGTALAADLTSNPVDANTQALHVNLAGTNAVNATLTAETTKVIGTVNIAAAQTLATVTTVSAVTAITNALPTGANNIGVFSAVTPTGVNILSAATTNATSVKAAAGTLYGLTLTNTGAAVAFFKLYNLAVAPTVGTSVPAMTVSIPASGVPVSLTLGNLGHRFATGIAYAITNLGTDADATAVTLNQVKGFLDYV